ncbi:TraR/DksA C4-type zinc finger protein [Candidatus Daviesbacteria bacterium]|nr:TraR/DksA C4-type zinc finger protein [Candidatus Daviesbacteria bacterium]
MNTFEKIRKLLLRQQKKVEENLKAMEKEDPVMNGGPAESSEPGTDSWLADVHSRVVAIKISLQDILINTKKALEKMRSGKYGKCENCRRMIEPQRLEAMPTATLCISCSQKSPKAGSARKQ